MTAFDRVVERIPPHDVLKVLLIKDNQLFFPMQSTTTTHCEAPCNKYMHHLVRAFRAWNATITFPDVVAYVSVGDWPQCGYDMKRCAAPVLSLIKRVNASAKLGMDILYPVPPERSRSVLFNVPWEHKVPKAFWRGTPYCNGYHHRFVKCSRPFLVNLTQQANNSHLLDVGFTSGYGRAASPGTGAKTGASKAAAARLPYVSIKDHARYKFLLHLDGITASYRLSKIMHTNSPVLKQESPWGEYFTRSLKPGVHYLPIFRDGPDDVLQVLQQYSDGSRDDELQQIAQNAQEFALRYTCPRARMLYFRRVLQQYRDLFVDMDEAIRSKWWPMAQRAA